MFKIVLANAVSWLLFSSILDSYYLIPAEALPVGALPKRDQLTTSGSDDDTETEAYTTAEHDLYVRVIYPRKYSPPAAGGKLQKNIHRKSVGYVTHGKLLNRNGFALRINTNGTVDGTSDKHSDLADLEFHSVGAGLLMILGVSSGRYLTISDTGLLYGSEEPSLNSVFREVHEENMFHSYLSYKHENSQWLMAIKRNGKAKKASQARIGQKSTQFLIIFSS